MIVRNSPHEIHRNLLLSWLYCFLFRTMDKSGFQYPVTERYFAITNSNFGPFFLQLRRNFSITTCKVQIKGFSQLVCLPGSLTQAHLLAIKWDFEHAEIQSHDALASKSHNCASYMQNHLCGGPNSNLLKYLCQSAREAPSFRKK